MWDRMHMVKPMPALYPKVPHISPPLPFVKEVKASGNVFGNYFQVATYGEPHGGGVGCVINGCPPTIPLSEADMQVELDRRLVLNIHLSSGGQSLEQLVGGAERAGFKAIALTVDIPRLGRKEVGIKNRFVLPPHLTEELRRSGPRQTEPGEVLN